MDIKLLLEAPLPDNWSKKTFKIDTPFVNRIRYMAKRSKLINNGSSRVAVAMKYQGRDVVLKVAMNNAGIIQNRNEVQILVDPKVKASGMFVPLIDFDRDNSEISWVQVERCEPLTSAIGTVFTRNDYNRLSAICRSFDPYGALKDVWNGTNVIEWEHPVCKRLLQTFIDNEQLARVFTADLLTGHNWGLFKGRPVILDIGYGTDTEVEWDELEDPFNEEAEDAVMKWKQYQKSPKWDGDLDKAPSSYTDDDNYDGLYDDDYSDIDFSIYGTNKKELEDAY